MTYDDRDRVVAWLDAGYGEKLTTLDRAILVTIAENVNGDSRLSWPGRDYLVRVWGVDARSVGRSIARLHDAGLLDTVQRGRGQRRARYSLIGEVGGLTGPPTSKSRGTETTEKGDRNDKVGGLTSPPISESSRRVRSDDDSAEGGTAGAARATASDGDGSAPPSAGSSELPASAELLAEVAARLDMTTERAAEWVAAKLKGRDPRNVPAYIRTCVENYTPPKPTQKRKANKPVKKTTTKKTAARKPVKVTAHIREHERVSIVCQYCNVGWHNEQARDRHEQECRGNPDAPPTKPTPNPFRTDPHPLAGTDADPADIPDLDYR